MQQMDLFRESHPYFVNDIIATVSESCVPDVKTNPKKIFRQSKSLMSLFVLWKEKWNMLQIYYMHPILFKLNIIVKIENWEYMIFYLKNKYKLEINLYYVFFFLAKQSRISRKKYFWLNNKF